MEIDSYSLFMNKMCLG